MVCFIEQNKIILFHEITDNMVESSSYKVLSLGLGVQSTALYYMSSSGEIPKCNIAIFVDVGREKQRTISYLKYLQNWQKQNSGIPIVVVKNKDLYKDLLDNRNSSNQRFSSIPAYTKNGDGTIGMLRRQCTSEYKIQQVDKEIRRQLRLSRITGKKVEIWKGISLDEIDRMSIPKELWKVHVYPFCGYAIGSRDYFKIDFSEKKTRLDIINWFSRRNLPVPPKSACVFCPYHSDAGWYEMKKNHPSDFRAAVKIDRAIRNSTKKRIKKEIFLHRSCVPLEDIVFKEGLANLWDGECSGACHT